MPSPAFCVLTAGVLVATAVDIRTGRIPNELTAAMCVAGLCLGAAGAGGMSLTAAVAGLVLGGALMLPGHLLGATGAGDVKLMAAVGALVGPATVIAAFLFTAVAGGVLAVFVAVRRRRLGATLSGTGRLISGPSAAREEIRARGANRFAYGPAIAAGSVLAVLVG